VLGNTFCFLSAHLLYTSTAYGPWLYFQNKLATFASNLELLKPREVTETSAVYKLGTVELNKTVWRRGFRATYLGNKTADARITGAPSQTFDCIDRLLQRNNRDILRENSIERFYGNDDMIKQELVGQPISNSCVDRASTLLKKSLLKTYIC
jgi:hypothetical protein